MGFVYTPSNTTANNKMNLSSWSLEISHALTHISSVFATTFLVSYIMQINASLPVSKTVTSIALYFIAQYGIMFLLCPLLFGLVDRSSRIWYYRLGIVIKGVFIVALVFIGKDLARLSPLAGLLYGISEMLYYSGYNIIKSEVIPKAHADKFIVLENVLNKGIKIVVPILLGLLIDVSSFISSAFYILAVVIIQLVFSFFIKCQRPENSSYNLIKYFKHLKNNPESWGRIKNLYYFGLAYGATAIHTSIVSFLTIYTFKTNLHLGIFTAVFNISAILVVVLFKRFTKVGKRKTLYYLLAAICLACSIIIAIWIKKWTYILYSLSLEVGICIFSYGFDVQRTIVLKKANLYDFIAEHQTVCELCFNFVRVISFVLMLALALLLELTGLKVLMGVLAIFYILMAIFVVKIEKIEGGYSNQESVKINSEEKL